MREYDTSQEPMIDELNIYPNWTTMGLEKLLNSIVSTPPPIPLG